MFFFISAENIQELRPKRMVTVTVPTALERQGNFSSDQLNRQASPCHRYWALRPPSPSKTQPPELPSPAILFPPAASFRRCRIISTCCLCRTILQPQDLAVSKGAYNYIFQESINVPKWLNSARLDYNFTDKTQFYARFNYWYEDQQGNDVSAANTTWGWLPTSTTPLSLSPASFP